MKKLLIFIGIIMLLNSTFLFAETYDDVENELEGETSQKMKEDFQEHKKENLEDFNKFKKEISEDKKSISISNEAKTEGKAAPEKEKKINEEALWQENKAKNGQDELDKEIDKLEELRKGAAVENKKENLILADIKAETVEIKQVEKIAVEKPKEIQKEEVKEAVKEEVKEEAKSEAKVEPLSESSISEKSGFSLGTNELILAFFVGFCVAIYVVIWIIKKFKKY
ncbi:MAG: hypothetical protein PHX78_00370 [bacterium]|nr:hypothetical protein [bacterium]